MLQLALAKFSQTLDMDALTEYNVETVSLKVGYLWKRKKRNRPTESLIMIGYEVD